MELETRTHYRLYKDPQAVLVSLLCLVGAAIGSYFLYSDINEQGVAGTGTPMGKIERRQSKVRRKASSSYVWASARHEEPVYRRDSIQTGPGSAAAIRLDKSGEVLEIGENSLFVIDDSANLSLGFKSGSIIVRKKDGTDSKITVGADGKAKIEQLPIRLSEPAALSEFFVAEGGEKIVRFKWVALNAMNLPASAAIEVSHEKNFSSHVQTFPTQGKSDLELKLPNGQYFWRLADQGKALTETSQFKVLPVVALKPTYPSPSDALSSYGDDSAIQFRWAIPKGATSENESNSENLIEVSRDADFKSLISQEGVVASAGSATLHKITHGSYFWRIRSKFGDVTLNSTTEHFKVEQAKRVEIEISRPAQASNLEVLPEIRLSWTSPVEKVNFKVEVKSRDGKTILAETTPSQIFTWKSPPAGAYQWRVSAVDASNQTVGESVWSRFTLFQGKPLALIEPKAQEKIFYWKDPTAFKFKWVNDPLADEKNYSYAFELAKDSDFKSLVHTETLRDTTLTSRKTGIGAGDYFWRVKLVDATGNVIKTSDAATLSYKSYPLLSAPRVAAPAPAKIFSIVEEEVPAANWSSIEGAKRYDVSVFEVDSTQKVRSLASQTGKLVFHEKVSKNSVELSQLPEGQYRLVVRAIDEEDRLGEADSPREFSVSQGATIAPPTPTSPEVQ